MTTSQDIRYRHRRVRLSLVAIGLLVINAAILLLAPALTFLALDLTVLIVVRIAMTWTRPVSQSTGSPRPQRCSIR